MVKHWGYRIAAVGCTVVMAACSGSDRKRETRSAGDQENKTPLVKLTGCLQPGSLETKYVLENIQMGREADQQTPTSDRSSDRSLATLAEGSLVQLRSDNEAELHKYLGQRISVTGRLIDSGASTIGTGGAQGDPTPSGDRSEAAAVGKDYSKKVREEAGAIGLSSIANGTAPTVHVESVNPTGRGCKAGLLP
jgi:hypothetical protein